VRAGAAALIFVLGIVLVGACGARTGLFEPEVETDASIHDATAEPGPPDVPMECAPVSYCDPTDPSHIYQCGRVVRQCDSLEQCEERESGANCINPCLDSLGNDTSNGCEFYAVEMDTTSDVAGVCYAVFIVNQWKTGEPAKIEVWRGDTKLPIENFARIPRGKGNAITYSPYSETAGLGTNDVAILFLSRDPAAKMDTVHSDPRYLADCPLDVVPPIIPAVSGDAALHGTGIGTAFRIETNVPVVAYQMLPYGGGRARVTGSTLLLPTSAWDTNYVVADAYKAPSLLIAGSARAGPTTVVIASRSSSPTHVTIKPTQDILPGGTVDAGTAAGVPATFTLSRGEYLQFTQPSELTGTAVQADGPVAVIGGSTLMDLPLDTPRADSAEQMLPPVRALGSEYVAVRYRNRKPGMEERVPWRIVGVVDGTVLTFDPPRPPGSQAPTGVMAQQVVEFDDSGPFVVRSQDNEHPFYLASYMTGGCGTPAVGQGHACPTNSPLDGTGDPEFVNVVPPAQFLPRYTFFTDPTYPETNLVVVRVRDPVTEQMPVVTLDCVKDPLSGWAPVGTAGVYEMTRVDLSTGDFQGVGSCDNGVHILTAKLPGTGGVNGAPVPSVGVTVWGWGNNVTFPGPDTPNSETDPRSTRWVSYGYPAGANFRPLNQTVLPAGK
jgi:hypothetical protein